MSESTESATMLMEDDSMDVDEDSATSGSKKKKNKKKHRRSTGSDVSTSSATSQDSVIHVKFADEVQGGLDGEDVIGLQHSPSDDSMSSSVSRGLRFRA